jgi:2-polyprenyl-6-methoxyphenol hydroxylase-like FAD-dependent oxidoreductase
VSVTWGASVTAVDAGDGGATVSLSDGTSRHVALVLGADGVHSTLRRLLFGIDAQPVGQVGWRLIAPCPTKTTAWTIQLGKGTSWLTIPIGGGRAYCYADQSADFTPDQPGDVEMLRAAFADFGEPARSVLASLPAETVVHTGVIEEVHLPQWHLGRVLLLGDAAHATSPNMAEGAAMALEDALVLAEVLTSSPTLDLALEDFERRRRGRTDWIREQTDRRDQLRQLPGWVRALAIRTVGQRVARANYAPLLTSP